VIAYSSAEARFAGVAARATASNTPEMILIPNSFNIWMVDCLTY
jgi:hypothetical protein